MSLRGKIFKGLTWSGLAQASRQISQFVVTAILAHLLHPDDFGLLGMATVFTGFVIIFNDMGLSAALIQKSDLKEDHLSSTFWLNIYVGIVLMLLMIIAALPISWFFKSPMLNPILIVISTNFLLASFTIVQKTILTKELEFKKLAVIESCSVIVAGIVGVYFAYIGYGVWSLVFQTLAFTFSEAVLLWNLSSWRPRWIFSKKAIKDIFHFSANKTGFEVINYLARNLDYLLVGKFLGAEALGYYTLAYKLMVYPLQNISWVIGHVMFPAFSQIQHDLVKVRVIYKKMVKSISLITFPMMFGLFALTPEFVLTVFGSQWQPSIILIQIFCACGVIQSVGTTVGNIILSQGRADYHFKLQIIGTLSVAIFLLIGLQWGVVGIAFMYTLQSLLWIHFTFMIGMRLIKLPYGEFYTQLLNSYFMSAVMMIVLFVVKPWITLSEPYRLICLFGIGVVTYGALLVLTKEIKITKRSIELAILT